MRVLKFRAWSRKWGLIYSDTPGFSIDVHARTVWKDCADDENVELMQFTGLLDSQGVEIYEGDIVRLVYIKCEGGGWKSNSNEIGRVYFDSTWGVKFDCKDLTQRTAESHWKVRAGRFNDATDVEVIGSIHENPELLK